MRRIVFIITVLIFSGSIYCQETNWHNFKSAVGKFEVDFLGSLEEQLQEAEASTTYKLLFKNSGLSFMVTLTTHSSDLGSDIQSLLDVSVEAFANSVKGSLINSTSITNNGVDGTEAVMNMMNDSFKLEYQVFIYEKYQYQVIAFGDINSYSKETADRFFNSFKILRD